MRDHLELLAACAVHWPTHVFCNRLAVEFNCYQYWEHQRHAHADLTSLPGKTVGGRFDTGVCMHVQPSLAVVLSFSSFNDFKVYIFKKCYMPLRMVLEMSTASSISALLSNVDMQLHHP